MSCVYTQLELIYKSRLLISVWLVVYTTRTTTELPDEHSYQFAGWPQSVSSMGFLLQLPMCGACLLMHGGYMCPGYNIIPDLKLTSLANLKTLGHYITRDFFSIKS